MTLGTALHEWRNGRSMRQAAKEFGCSAQNYGAWEDDYSVPGPEWFNVLRQKLAIDADTLLALLVASRTNKLSRRGATRSLVPSAA